ncbi:uncharacterized protein LACBIDRAFT_297633 [Laccaria bicolor S238N-H82]|uniref:Predicted protein n=1 Tax=Laccaria bicolor (strain S238N-H82 / ATCC MYA-4686) TaxID=486041 RepID=B0DBN2_LACBS|nr:uncharacterized protein LACBIDRAFT_297633 [Laccaria bicolor S238N-H82]EDR08213.1 predicted protein [Laccaria bicolor S238N-H82]|eukprot:XP_001881283.1 predicted protein [Laccaria bicolor S238N-H82]
MDPLRDLFFQRDATRRSIIASYWLVIILALPLWWHTTTIHRLSLPSSRVEAIAHNELLIPINICLVTNDHTLPEKLHYHLGRTTDYWKALDVHVFGDSDCSSLGEGVYRVAPGFGLPELHGRTLLFPYQDEETLPALADALSSLLVPYSSLPDREHRVAQYSPRYRLAFSLLNEDASAGHAILNWDAKTAIHRHITPILRSLSMFHNFTVESQVQYYAPLAFSPQLLEDGSYGLTHENLTVFINSAEWTLSSSASNDPVLHFILFVPSADRKPLRILDADGNPSTSNSFLLPQWGGIVLHNSSSFDESNDAPILQTSFSAFSHQLLSLLGIPQLPIGIRDTASGSSIREWQLDALLRRRTLENAKGSQDTLKSIIKLVDQIENMPVGEDVKGDVEDALEELTKMYESATSSLQQTFRHSALALGLASRAFFNPGMLALLYFPAEHKYAVYTPLFASAVIPLFVAALRELKAWRLQRKAAAAAGVQN